MKRKPKKSGGPKDLRKAIALVLSTLIIASNTTQAQVEKRTTVNKNAPLNLKVKLQNGALKIFNGDQEIGGLLESHARRPIYVSANPINTLIWDVEIKGVQRPRFAGIDDFKKLAKLSDPEAESAEKAAAKAMPDRSSSASDPFLNAVVAYLDAYGRAVAFSKVCVKVAGSVSEAGGEAETKEELNTALGEMLKGAAGSFNGAPISMANVNSADKIEAAGQYLWAEVEKAWIEVKSKYPPKPNEAAQRHMIALTELNSDTGAIKKFKDAVQRSVVLIRLAQAAEFVVPGPTITPKSGVVDYLVKLSPIKDSPFGDPTKLEAKEMAFEVEVVGGIEIDTSSGFLFSGLRDRKYVVSIGFGSPVATEVGPKNDFEVSQGVLMHVYKGGSDLAGTFGLGTRDGKQLQWMAGVSWMFVGTDRFVLTIGVIGGTTKVLDESAPLVVGSPAPLTDRTRTSWFLGITYNIK